MIAYFDPSSLVPLLLLEPGSAIARRGWLLADRPVTVRIAYAEARAALAAAQRAGRIDLRRRRQLVDGLDLLDRKLTYVEVTPALVRRAGAIAEQYGLRGYDAVHLAAADAVSEPDLVLFAGDGALRAAAQAMGMRVSPLSESE